MRHRSDDGGRPGCLPHGERGSLDFGPVGQSPPGRCWSGEGLASSACLAVLQAADPAHAGARHHHCEFWDPGTLRVLAFGLNAILKFPFSARVALGRGLVPDARVKLIEFRAGAHADELAAEAGGRRPQCLELSVVSRTAGLALLQYLLPGAVGCLGKILFATGIASLALACRSHARRTLSFLSPWRRWRRKRIRKTNPVCRRPAELADQMFDAVGQLSLPAVLLQLTESLWQATHSDSRKLLHCVITLLSVSSSYNAISRQCSGEARSDVEDAWRKAHRSAARRVAPLLGDLPDRPPLKPLLNFLETISSAFGTQNSETSTQPCWATSVHGPLAFSFPIGAQSLVAPLGTTCLSHTHSTKGTSECWEVSSRSQSQDKFVQCSSACCYGMRPFAGFSESAQGAWRSTNVTCPSGTPPQGTRPVELVSWNDSATFAPILDSLPSDLPLYGRADHAQHQSRKRSQSEQVALVARAAELLFAFLPFLLLGSFLMLLSWMPFEAKQEADADSGQVLCRRRPHTAKEGFAAMLRTWAFQILLMGCRQAGPAFIKWAQWSSTRVDIFPQEFCDVMSSLHDQAPIHSFGETRAEFEAMFHRPLESVFESFDAKPIASGSIAQVYRATIAMEDNTVPVVVKVRHPNVSLRIKQDFQILKSLASTVSCIPGLGSLPIKETVSQFSNTMTAQADLRVEAAHLIRFGSNFAPYPSVVVPVPIAAYVSESVLVESFEEGCGVSHYIQHPAPLNGGLVALGVDVYIKMLLQDNFVHTDLHPGNILARSRPGRTGQENLQLVLLDYGLAEELSPQVRRHFISFLNLICAGNGRRAAWHLLRWSDRQMCPHREGFVDAMADLFDRRCDIGSEGAIDLDAVIKSTLRLCRRHAVSVDSKYAALMISVCIIVGLAKGLDPKVNLVDAAAPGLLMYSLSGRVIGRLYGKGGR
ncbi:unnamed protein product [Ostreobium quekettii]|uniref:Protein kinase domain-containing protein n=1 Tax=Ostreobium quekettii TaxID=121088 RepID=A0A8S1J0N4_9CHLO|nr:unnamed protein product [Ostreobium quekettii]|eukprot:evm.model.scf_26.19 EVM.evm.TU.scf_26.19   scf_26:150921-157396(-)